MERCELALSCDRCSHDDCWLSAAAKCKQAIRQGGYTSEQWRDISRRISETVRLRVYGKEAKP